MPDKILISGEDTLFPEDDFATELTLVTPDSKARSAKDQRDSIELTYSLDRTYLVMVAVHRDTARNTIHKISCKKCLPMGGYVYDATNDSYAITCTDYLVLGYLPVSMKLRIQGMSSFVSTVPMCDTVVKRFLSPTQSKDIKSFRAVYKPEDHHLYFVQMIDCNG